MKHRIRGRDGAIREVCDGYVLQNGEAYVVEMTHMDSRRRAMIHSVSFNEARRISSEAMADIDDLSPPHRSPDTPIGACYQHKGGAA